MLILTRERYINIIMQMFTFCLLCWLITSYATNLSSTSAQGQVIIPQTRPPKSQVAAVQSPFETE